MSALVNKATAFWQPGTPPRAWNHAFLSRWGAYLLCVPSLLLLLALLLLPLARMALLSFQVNQSWSFVNYARLLGEPYFSAFVLTFKVALLVTTCTVLLGYPTAYILSKASDRTRNWLIVLVLMPYWTSVLVRAFAWIILLQRQGLVNDLLIGLGIIATPLQLTYNLFGTVVGMVHVMLPFLILPLLASMRKVDPALVPAARSCGASPVRAFWSVFFPATFPGLAAGALTVFVMALGYYVIPALLGGGKVTMWAMLIESTLTQYADVGVSSALGVALLVVTFIILGVVTRLTRIIRGGTA